MTRAIGSSAVVKFCQEVTWGTTPLDPTVIYGMNIRSESLDAQKNLFESETINDKRAVIGLGDGNRGVDGDLVADLLPEGQEVLFAHLLGDTSVSTTGSGPYTHVINGSATYREGVTIEKDFVNITKYIKYTGCRINSCTINFIQEGFHDVTFSFVGKSEYTGTYDAGGNYTPTLAGDQMKTKTETVVYPTKSGFTGYQVEVWVATAGGAYSAALGNVVSGSISINNNIETDGYVLGDAERASASFGKRQCTGNFTTFFEDLTLYADIIAGTEKKIKFVCTSGTDVMTIEFPRVKLGGSSPKVASASGLNLELSFSARYDTSSATDVIITFVNSTASVP